MIWTLHILTFDEETSKRLRWLIATLRRDLHVTLVDERSNATPVDHGGWTETRHIVTVNFLRGVSGPKNLTLQHLDRVYAEFRPAESVEPEGPEPGQNPKRPKTRWDYLMEDDD